MKRFNVIFSATGRNEGCFDTAEEAQAHINAINAEFPDLKFHILDLTQVFK